MLNNQEIKALLQWHIGLGIDETLSCHPVDRTIAKPPPAIIETPPVRLAPAPIPAAAPAAASLAQAITESRQLADTVKTLADLEAAVRHFEGCSLKKTAKNTVFADGTPDSDVMLIGEAPGADEDRQGIPFCGASGQLLDLMLRQAGLERSRNFYITNTLFWRPPGNRTPLPDELQICLPFVEKHIALINPKLLILVGNTAAKNLLGENSGVTRLRSKQFHYTNQYIDGNIATRVIFHPSYLLRQPAHKRIAWQDLLDIREKSRLELGLSWH